MTPRVPRSTDQELVRDGRGEPRAAAGAGKRPTPRRSEGVGGAGRGDREGDVGVRRRGKCLGGLSETVQ